MIKEYNLVVRVQEGPPEGEVVKAVLKFLDALDTGITYDAVLFNEDGDYIVGSIYDPNDVFYVSPVGADKKGKYRE